jgi:hypothetical protein
MLWIDPNEISSWLATSWIVTSVLEKQLLHSSHLVLCFANHWVPKCLGFFRKGYTTHLENHSKLVFFTFQKLFSTVWKFLLHFYPVSKITFTQAFLSSLPFSNTNGTTHFSYTQQYATLMYYIHIPSWKWFDRHCCIPNIRSLLLQQSRNCALVFHIYICGAFKF